MREAKLWRFFDKVYVPAQVDDRCKTYSNDMSEIVVCPNCNKELRFGDCYTSRRWHSDYGIAYAVCEKCYEEELRLERKARSQA